MKKIIEKYSKLISSHPVWVIIICLVFSALMIIGIQMMKTQEVSYSKMLPEKYDVIKAYNLISEEFGGTTSGTIVVQIENSYANSNEVQSVLDPEAVRYMLTLEKYFSKLDYVESVSSFSQIVEETYGYIPNNQNILEEIYNSYESDYISEDESMALIKINFREEDETLITNEISELIEQIDKPAGIKVSLAGEVFEDPIIDAQLGPDISKTSIFSMIAIIVILIILFRSIKGVSMPLMTIIFGIIWTMGFIGLMHSGMSSMTSGAVSMIMGIGIDFGIQIMNRYNQELKHSERKKAMEKTLNGVLPPILTTAIACLIGFKAMSLGELSMMAELGNIMSLGILFCMIAAITLVPSLLILLTKKKKKD